MEGGRYSTRRMVAKQYPLIVGLTTDFSYSLRNFFNRLSGIGQSYQVMTGTLLHYELLVLFLPLQ